ncbi:hypothetical protein SAJ_1386 [Streptococcus agalactiae 18RS21]|nr:hypothetical protein SAJ_1386 [Streptococcus agalactiae 18RS21]
MAAEFELLLGVLLAEEFSSVWLDDALVSSFSVETWLLEFCPLSLIMTVFEVEESVLLESL